MALTSETNPRAQLLIDGFVCVDCGWRPLAGGPIEALTAHCRTHWPEHAYESGEVHHRTMAWDAAHDMFLMNHEARQWFQTIDTLRAEHAALRSERDAYEATARDMANNSEFWRGLVIKTGELFGVEARTADDGSVMEDVLALKVPELVEAQQRDLATAHEETTRLSRELERLIIERELARRGGSEER